MHELEAGIAMVMAKWKGFDTIAIKQLTEEEIERSGSP